jgi:hypothetical protein
MIRGGVAAGEVLATVQALMLAELPYSMLRDAVLAHPTMAERLGPLLSMCRLARNEEPPETLRGSYPFQRAANWVATTSSYLTCPSRAPISRANRLMCVTISSLMVAS